MKNQIPHVQPRNTRFPGDFPSWKPQLSFPWEKQVVEQMVLVPAPSSQGDQGAPMQRLPNHSLESPRGCCMFNEISKGIKDSA